MTEPAPPTALLAARCPGCATPLDDAARCATCRLLLRGPAAARLWEVDVALAELGTRQDALLVERGRLLALLRTSSDTWSVHGSPPTPPTAPLGPAPPAAAHPRREWTPARVQNLLLSLGALLLAVAATVFGAVTYERLGVGGRAVVLLALTAAAAAAAPRLRARGLGATAESLAAVAVVLALLDAWGLRRLGLGQGLADATWVALALAGLSAASAGYAVATGLRVPRLASLVLAHVAGLAAVSRLDPDAAQASLLLTLFAAVHVVAVAALVRRSRTAAGLDLLGGALAGAVVAGSLGLALGGLSVVLDDRSAALALLGSALLAAGGAAAGTAQAARTGLAALPVPLVAVAVLAAVRDEVSPPTLPVLAAAVALAGAAGAALLGRRYRAGVLCGSAAVSSGALAAVGGHVLGGLLGPLGWAADPWSLPSGAAARAALSPDLDWTGSWAVVPVLLLVGAAAAAAGLLLDRRELGHRAAAAFALCALLLAPLAGDLPHGGSVALLLVVTAGLLSGAEALRDRAALAPVLLAAAAVPAAQAAGWSLATQTTTLSALPVLTVLLVVAAARPWAPAVQAVATALAGTAGAASLTAVGAARGLSAEQVGGLLLVVPALLVLLSRLPQAGSARRAGAQVAAAVVALTAVLLAVGDPGWLSWTLAGSGLLVLLVAVEPDRRVLAPVAGLLVSASSWVRLADAGVDAPEPYVLPLAAIALWIGHLRFRRDPATRSQTAYGPGLGLLLVPSLLAALLGSGLGRPLLLGALALGVLLVGARARLQAPLAFGAGTLAVLALELLGPYASAAPRWIPLAVAGALLVGLGATYEQRRRDLDLLRDRYAGLR